MAVQSDTAYEDEDNQSDLPSNKTHITNVMLIESIANDTSDSNGLGINTNFDQSRDSNKVSESSHKEDDSITNADSYATSLSKKVLTKKHSISSTSKNYNVLCCKISIIISVCCIIGFFLLPIIFYAVNQTRGNTEGYAEHSHENNTSNTKITIATCNFSDPNCVEQILYTFEALKTINLPLSQQYCSERVETLFCDAFMECSNESYVKDIVCRQVRQEYCTAEWRMLEVNQTDGLIDCTDYGETAPLHCGDQFDIAYNESVCLPLCGEFSQYSKANTNPHIILYATSLLINTIGGIIVIAFSFWKKKKMFHFPQILVPINAGNTIIVSKFQTFLLRLYKTVSIFTDVLLSITTVSVGRWNILCSSKFLFDALNNPTTFCTVQGFVLFSGLVLYSYFWLLYIFHLALNLLFPLKSAKFFNSGYRRTIYIAEFLIVFLIGTVPSIVSAGLSRYRISRFPPIYCDGYDDRTYIFYSTTVPILTTVCVSLILMILILCKVHNHQGIFKKKHKGSAGKQVRTCQFSVPEVKIGFVLFYWLILTILIWTTASIRNGRDDTFAYNLRAYADCMAGGNRKDHDCHKLRLDLEAETNFVIEAIYLILVAFLNFASLPFVIQFQTVKHTVRQVTRRLSARFDHERGDKFTMKQENCNAVVQVELADKLHHAHSPQLNCN